jgi:serine/threonine protein kinase
VSSEFSVQQYAAMASLVPGRQLAGYVIEEQVGAGGMAVVFRARDGVLGRLAALKVLAPSLAADSEFRSRFLSESRAVASVEEPHIIPVYGAGEVDGVLYIASRFVAGGDLADALQQAGGKLQPARVASLIDQVGSALDAAHAAGLVHRDVKPGNILLDTTPGRPEHAYLSDFGLSKAAMANNGLTATGMFLGTPDYAAPEQIKGVPLDGRADQYSLACMAFVLLAGDAPFRRQETMATLFAHLNDPVPPLARYQGGLPPAADAVLARGLAKEPADRYERCGDFAAALHDALLSALPPTRHDGRTVLSTDAGAAGLPGMAPTRQDSGPSGSRPAYAPETAAWSGSPSQPPAAAGMGATAAMGSPAPQPTKPQTYAPQHSGAQYSNAPDSGAQYPGTPNSGAPTWSGQPVPPGPTYPGQSARGAAPAVPPNRVQPAPRPGPPPAAGQGGKLPLVSKSAVIAALAAAAVLLLIFLLHGTG